MAIIKGAVGGLAVYTVLVVIVSLSRTIEASLVGRLIWESLVPMGVVEKITSSMFGSHTDERGLVVILVVVGSEFVLVGSAIAGIVEVAGHIERYRQ